MRHGALDQQGKVAEWRRGDPQQPELCAEEEPICAQS
jgi:hypothetical protein